MRKNLFVLIIVLSPFNFGFCQNMSSDLTDQDTTVLGGTVVDFIGFLTTDTLQVYNCCIIAENVSFPNSWFFAICNPFLCASSNVPEVCFSYPDTVNNQIFSGGFGGSLIKLSVFTSSSTTPEIGELDLKLKNNTLNDSSSVHIIVRTNGQSVGIDDVDNSDEIYFDPINKYIIVPENLVETNYEIFDMNGAIAQSGLMQDKISYEQLLSGHFVLKYQVENNVVALYFNVISK